MASPETCPNCGAAVPPDSRACPECGACDETGWSEQVHAGGLGLPDEDFDYQDFVNREFGGKKPLPRGISPFWWLIAIAVLLVIIAIYIF